MIHEQCTKDMMSLTIVTGKCLLRTHRHGGEVRNKREYSFWATNGSLKSSLEAKYKEITRRSTQNSVVDCIPSGIGFLMQNLSRA